MAKNIQLTRIDATLGAEVRGVALGAALDSTVFAEIESAWHTHAVLVFPGQHLDDAAQIGFTRLFGASEGKITQGNKSFDQDPGFDVMSNLNPDGTPIDPHGPMGLYLKGDAFWHTDSSFKPVPAKASLMRARQVTSAGGETAFADMRAAYDVVDDATKRWLEDKRAVHSYAYSQGLIGGIAVHGQAELDALPPVEHPLVHYHPATGRKSLYLGRHASHIVGEQIESGRERLAALCEAACQPPRVFQHRWKPGDLILWDNRCVLHRACPYPPDQGRIMARSTVAGDGSGNEWSLDI